MLIIFVVVLFLFAIYILYVFLPLLEGGPYVPTRIENVEFIIKTLKEDYGIERFIRGVDVGSGDGRIVISLAKAGIDCDGIEKSKLLCNISQKKAIEANVQDRCKFINSNFFDVNLAQYDLVVAFQAPYVMNKLGKKIKREMKPGSIVASYCYKIGYLNEVKYVNYWHIYEV